MDKRRLLLGSAVLLMVVGLLLAAFTPGGWFNNQGSGASFDTPIGPVSIQEKKSSPWPIIGYVLIGVGGVELVLAFAMKPPRGA